MSNLFSISEPMDAFAFVGGVRNPSQQEIGELGAELLLGKYKELFATMDLPEVAGKLLSFVRIHAPKEQLDIKQQLAWSELAILTLLERGAIRQTLQTPESLADLQKLQAAVIKSGLRPPVPAAAAVTAEAVPAEADPVEACVSDFKSLPSSTFRKTWMQNADNRKIYERAISAGRI